MTTHVATGFAGEVDGCTLEVVRRAPDSSRNTSGNAGEALGVSKQGLVHICGDVTRGDSVDGNALSGPFVGEALGQLANGALGGSIGGHGEAALEGQQRGKVDDAAATAGDGGGFETEHVGADIAAEGKDGVQVNLDDLRYRC